MITVHELTITSELVSLLLAEFDHRKLNEIKRVNLVIGDLTGIEIECIKFYFEILSEGTSIQGTHLCIETQKSKYKCQKCSHIYERYGFSFDCPRCYSNGIMIEDGTSIFIKSMEVM